VQLNWILGAACAMALVVPASAQVSIYIRSGPPPIRYEQRTQAPISPGYVWVDGYWAPQGRHYQWVPGRWQQPPYEGAHWNHPHYDHYKQGWQLHEGHWTHEDNDKGRGHDDDHGHEGNGNGHKR
jgi:WXXGXW repeat (2 copies)